MIRKLAPYTKGYRVWIFLGVLCSAGEAVLELLLPKAMSQIVDVGIANGDKAYILAMGLKMILMALASLVMGVGARLFQIAGPVLVYGIGSSVIVGVIAWLVEVL